MEIKKQIKHCRLCIFFITIPGQAMECEHPIFKKLKRRLLLSHEDIDSIPAKCPLRDEDLVIEYSLFNEKERAFLKEIGK